MVEKEVSEGILDWQHRRLTLGTILAISVVAFEALALATVAPVIARDLDGLGLYGWIFSAFLLAQIVGAVAAGEQVDRRGPAVPFLVSLMLLGAGLFVGALSPGMGVLIFGRALQGLGGGALVACVYTIINTSYPDSLRPRMMAAFSSAFILPALVGPAIAGFVADEFTWRAIFYGFLPFLFLVGVLAVPAFDRQALKENDTTAESPELGRLPGAILLAAGTGLLLAGLKIASGEKLALLGGQEVPAVVVSLLMVLVGILVVVPALRKVLPYGTLVARRGLPATVSTKGLMAAAYFYTEAYLVLTLNEVSDYRATTAGLVISAGAISWTAGTWLQERLDRRHEGRGRRTRVLNGAVLMTIGILSLAAAVIIIGEIPLSVALAGWLISGLGMGFANPASATIAFAHAPSGREGVVSSSVLIAELFGPATIIGVGGALVALGAASDGGVKLGVALAFGLSPLLVFLLLISALRLPPDQPNGAS